jgi:CspA family cold shock protein
MPSGTVKFFTGRFGFLIPDEGGADVFVHARDLAAAGLVTLNRDERVEFSIVRSPNSGRTKVAYLRRL